MILNRHRNSQYVDNRAEKKIQILANFQFPMLKEVPYQESYCKTICNFKKIVLDRI